MAEGIFPTTKRNDKELIFVKPLVNIGSHLDNDLVLSGAGVLPFHAMIIAKEGDYLLLPLSPDAKVLIGNQPIGEGTSVLKNNHLVIIGENTIQFTTKVGQPGFQLSVTSIPSAESLISLSSSEIQDNVILATSSARVMDIQVSQTAFFDIEVVNAGPIVAGFLVNVRGLPDEWVEIRPKNFNLNEGRRTNVSISVTPPKDPASRAGTHPFIVVISSPNYPGLQTELLLELIIQPYYEFTLGNLIPKQQNITYQKKFGLAKLPLTNLGNGDTEFSAMAIDDENGCTFDFQLRDDLQLSRQATFSVPAGATFILPIHISPHKRPIFSMHSKRYQYTTTIQTVQQASSQQVVSGSATNYPLFGWWSIVLGILAVVLGLFILVQPRISSFEVVSGKDVIELGDTTKLEWSVSPFASRLNISNSDEAITYGQTSLVVAPKQSTNYELLAGNWLSGILGLDQKKTQTVLVVPPQPQVNVFEVDNTEVPRGKAVKVRWSVTKAEKAILTMGGVVYELTPDKFSGEQTVVLEKDSLITMEALNASGSELKSYFINVVDPYVTINNFTVWVRPQTKTTLLPSSQILAQIQTLQDPAIARVPHLARPASSSNIISNAPPKVDDSFTDKYVALVSDKSSDTGYRVEFYQPDRELSKGEQVMIEWNVLGTNADTVQIAPFTDILPNTGRQPFFPQESMNFVLTAQSGEEQKLFMLPVVVFDGTPPTAPKIDIFKASPLSMLGAGSTQFAWSVSGEWTRVQLASGKGVVADYMNPQGFKTVSVNKSDTFILTAWNGSLSSSQALDITINPALIAPGLSITSVQPTTGRFMVGGKLTVTVAFTSIPKGKPNPTGSVTVTDGNAICSISLPASSCDLIFKNSGSKSIVASFPGDAIYQQSNAPAFPGSIIVASAQVDLTPSFYFKGSTSPVAVENTYFELDKGMDIRVEVRPKNTILADNNGNVAVSLCNQSLLGVVDTTSCVFVGSAQVKVAVDDTTTQTAGYGYADITIQNFNGSGIKAFLFEYTHSTNAIDPTSFTQPNVNISRAKLLLGLSSCDDPTGFVNCSYGLSDSTTIKLLFDLYLPASPSPLLLSSLLPTPQASAFTITSTPAATWSCSIGVNSGTHKLVCYVTGLVAGQDYLVNYQYDNTNPLPSTFTNDYYMGADPSIALYSSTFTLSVLNSTKTQIGNLSGVKVGERVYLTGPEAGGLISVLSSTNSPLTTTGGLTLEAKSGVDVFGVVNEGLNCTRDSTNQNIIHIAAANTDCFIYFKHVGNYTLVASFEGDEDNNSSISGDTQVTVLKQTQISGVLEYFDSGDGTYKSFPSSWIKNVELPVRLILTGPTSNFSIPDTSFPPSALVERKILVTLGTWAATNCTIVEGTQVVLSSPGVYEIAISSLSNGDPLNATYVTFAEFKLTCTATDTLGLSLNVTFSDKTTPKKDSDDLGFISPVAISNVIINPPSSGAITVTILREDSTATNMLTGGTISKLHFGQVYDFEIPVNGSSDVPVPYTYTVDYTYTYTYERVWHDWDIFHLFGYWVYRGLTITPHGTPSSISTATQNTIITNYSNSSKWTVDPSNFLSQDSNLAKTSESTCGSNMAMTAVKQSNSSTPGNEYYGSTILNGYAYASGNYWIHVEQHRRTFYGTVKFKLRSNAVCKIAFDSTTDVNNAITSTSGTITVSAVSSTDTNPLFSVTRSFGVNGIDRQLPNTFNFSPSAKTTVLLNTDLPITATLSSSEISSGTSLPFVDLGLPFSSQFTPYPANYSSCTGLSRTDTLNADGVIQTFRSTSGIPSTLVCNLQLKYGGNKYYQPIGPTDLPEMVFLEPAGVSLSASPSTTATYGSSVTFTATTSPGMLPGSVVFKDGGTTIGSQTVTTGSSTGTASISISTLSIGGSPHSITAIFTPTDTINYSAVTSLPKVYTITSATTTTSLAVSPASPQLFGTTVTLTATVTPTGQAGNVVFKDGSTVIGNSNVVTATGIATLNVSNLSVVGSPHSITAVFTPTDTNFGPSTSAAQIYTTTTSSSTVIVAQSTTTSIYGNSVTFTATVPTLASGSVTFKDGITVLSTIDVSSGTAQYITSALDVVSSPHSITAQFTPSNTNYSGSTSSAISHTITAAPTTTSAVTITAPAPTVPPNTFLNTQNLTFQVTVSSTSSLAYPFGTVTFYKNGISLGTVTVSAGTNTSLNYILSNEKLTPAGTYAITATFAPSSTNILGSDSATPNLSVITQ